MSEPVSRASVRRKFFVAVAAADLVAALITPCSARAFDPPGNAPLQLARTGCHASFAYSGGEDHVAEFFQSAGVDHRLGVVVGLRFALGAPKHRAAAPQLALWHPGGGTAADINCGGRN